MANLDDVRRIASGLPGAVEGEGDQLSLGVEGRGKVKGFAWAWMERVHPKKPKVPNPDVLAIVTPGLGAKEVRMGSEPDRYVVDPHYDGFPAVLVRLEAIGVDELEELLIDAWRTKATKEGLAEFEAEGGR